MAPFDWDQFAQRVNEVQRAVEAHSRDKAEKAVPLVMNAWYHAGAANVALELATSVDDPDRRRAFAELFTAPQDLLDWTAFSLGTRSTCSALDLCAAAAWRLSGGKPLKGGREQDLDQGFRDRAKLPSSPLRDWLVRAHESMEYPPIQAFRHGFTHRLVGRHIKIRLGEPIPLEIESEVARFRQTATAHLRIAASFAGEQFSAFCDALGDTDSPLRARVLARLARALVFTPQAEQRLQFSEEAVVLARRLGDPATLAAVLFDRHMTIWGPDRPEAAGERLAMATEVVHLAERTGDRAMALRGRGLRRTDLLELGDLAGFDADLAAAEQTAQELRQLHYRWQLPLARATGALLAGRFALAEEQAAQGLAIGRRAGDQAVEVYYPGVVGTLRFMQGRFGETVELYQDLATRFPAMPVFRTSLAAALAEAGRADQAQTDLERLAAGDLAALPRDATWSFSLALLALACHHLGDTEFAVKLQGLLEPYADRNIVTGRFGAFCLGPASYFLGLLDLTLDRHEEADRRFAHAATLGGRHQARPMVAMSHEGQARALLALDRPGGRQQAQALLEEIAATAQQLGIHGLGERASATLEELAAPAAPTWPAGLTGREVEVLGLIAAGCSNRAIAQTLYISPNNVLRHVSNIFTKTGVANRAGAAAYATRHGLTG